MYGFDHGGWMMFGGGLTMLLVWLVPMALVIALVVYLFRSPRAGDISKTALDILRERYARGEIGKDEFEQKKRDLDD